jgi:hypothetical protein
MIRVALLGRGFASQLAEHPDELGEVEVVWTGSDADAFRIQVPALQPTVVVLDAVEGRPLEALRALITESKAQLALVTYGFASRSFLRELRSDRIRVLQGPVTLSALRTHLSFLIVQDMLSRNTMTTPPRPAPSHAPAVPAPRRYTTEQLARLLEVSSTVKCECPNHVADLVTRLTAFEDYELSCANATEADRQVHSRLHALTVQARRPLEEALALVIEHDGLTLT